MNPLFYTIKNDHRKPSAKRRVALTLMILSLMLHGCALGSGPDVPNIETYFPNHSQVPGSIFVPPASPINDEKAGIESSFESPLTLESCIQIALDQNPARRAALEGITVAEEKVGEARSSYYPQVNLKSGYNRWQKRMYLPEGISNPGISNMVGPTDDWIAEIETRLLLFDNGLRRAQMMKAMAMQGSAREEHEKIRQDIILSVHQTFYGVIAAKELASVALENINRSEDHLRLTQALMNAGAAPEADVLRAQVELATAKLESVHAQNMVAIAKGNLNTAMGLDVELEFDIAPHSESVISIDQIDLQKDLAQSIHNRPELKAGLQRVAAKRYAVEEAESAFSPHINAEGGYGWRDDEFLPKDEEWLVGAFVEWPIFTGFSSTHRLSGAKAELKKEEAQIQQLIQQVRQEVWNANSKLKETREALTAADALVRDAQESLRAARKRYEVSAGTITDLLDAQTALSRAEATRITALWDYRNAISNYFWATGEFE
jgi:outer membrane protein